MPVDKANRVLRYVILILLSVLCLFSFYILIVNSTRLHSQIQKGFSILPDNFFTRNLNNVLANKEVPVVKGIINSLFVAGRPPSP